MRSVRSRPLSEAIPAIPEAPAVQIMNENSVTSATGQDGGESAAKPSLPSRWWIVAACLLAGLAVAGQGISMFGLLEFNASRVQFDAQIEEGKRELEKLRIVIDTLRTQESTVRTTLVEIGPQVTEAKAHLTDATTRLAETNTKLLQTQAALEEVKAQGRTARDENSATEAAIARLNKLQVDLTGEVTRLTSQRDSLAKTISENEATLKQQNTDILNSRGELSRLDQAIVDLRSQQRAAQDAFLKLQGEMAALTEATKKLAQLEQDAARVATNNQQLESTHADLIKKVETQQAVFDGLLDRSGKARTELTSLDGQVTEQRKALLTVQTDIAAAELEKKNLSAQRDQLKADVTATQSEVNRLTGEKDSLAKLVEEKSKEQQRLDTELGQLQVRLDEILKRTDRARTEEASLLGHIDALRAATTRSESIRPAEEPLPLPGTPSPSIPGGVKPPGDKTPPGKFEPTEPSKE